MARRFNLGVIYLSLKLNDSKGEIKKTFMIYEILSSPTDCFLILKVLNLRFFSWDSEAYKR